ncbi:zinc finger protein 772 isoform X1 [Prionailurus iriomotensis]
MLLVWNEKAPLEQCVSGVFQFRTPKAGPSTQKDMCGLPPTCDMCGLVLKDILYLAKHQAIHPRQKPYKCETCGRGFWLSTNSHQHQKEHSEEKLFTCSQDLLQHQTTHTMGKLNRSPARKEAF